LTTKVASTFQVVDLFAGPGGLAEGFASVSAPGGARPFQIALSVEKDHVAHGTLRFRAFLRQFTDGFPDKYYSFLNGEIEEPNWAEAYPDQWAAAEKEALLLELGSEGADQLLQPYLDSVKNSAGDQTIVIGGPPCQAYSIAGRARNKGVVDYEPEKDNRHFLYQEYIKILEILKPAAFVMENVKGILSSSVGGQAIFKKILADLDEIGGDDFTYELYAFESDDNGAGCLRATREPKDFLIRSEFFGVPQARHRIIIIGVRQERIPQLRKKSSRAKSLSSFSQKVTVKDVLAGLPRLRSGVSKGDSVESWKSAMARSVADVMRATSHSADENLKKVYTRSRQLALQMGSGSSPTLRSDNGTGKVPNSFPPSLRAWIIDPKLKRLSNHASRGHMESDLARYFFASVYAEICGRSPVAKDYPIELAPSHKNWETGIFSDRFRVQLWGSPSTTITSHIAKDGHYFIHPDPLQCRALTVREAARLQTFPDNYRFLGNRTQQFEQVGNAVPPFLARQIGSALHTLLNSMVHAGDKEPG